MQYINDHVSHAVIKVIGVGGGGGNAVENMIGETITGVEFICANTDIQALKKSSADIILPLGEEVTRGLGAGADPEVGRLSAEENREKIREVLAGTDMVFITAGMGGGTGTGAAPIVAEIAKEMGILTVAVVTKPFSFEGRKRMLLAEEGIKKLAENVDSLITIPNNKLLTVLGKNVSLLNAFKAANNVLLGAVQGIAELITKPGLINVDFADVRTVMGEMGVAMMGTAEGHGEGRARDAAESAISSPLLEDVNLSGAGGVLVNITGGLDMSIGEFEEVGEVIKSFVSSDATVVVGTVIDPDMDNRLRVTVVVTGLSRQEQQDKVLKSSVGSAFSVGKSNDKIMRNIDGQVDYKQLERPTAVRNKQVKDVADIYPTSKMSDEVKPNDDMDYFDIPAFLRKKDKQNKDNY